MSEPNPHPKLLFLDRDGVINHDTGYVGKPADFTFIPGIFTVIHQFVNAGFLPVIVTNQSGIGRGYYSESDFAALCEWMQNAFTDQGLPYIPVYYCPHHPEHAQGNYQQLCDCRKPAPGMLLAAARDLNAELSSSVLLGDSWRDIQAGAAAGLPAQCYINATPAEEATLGQSNVFHAPSVAAVTPMIPAIIAASKNGSDA